jgi:hypothetical protein
MRRTPLSRIADIRREVVIAVIVAGLAMVAVAAWRTRTVSDAAPPPPAVGRDSRAEPDASSPPAVGTRTPQIPEPLSASQIWPVEVLRISPRPAAAPQRGLYDDVSAAPRTDIKPFLAPAPHLDAWNTKPFGTIVSELSPAVLYRSEGPELTFFNGIEAWGHGGPTHVAVRTAAGVLVAGRGEQIDGALQSEPWILAWFAGAEGWMFDVPWLVVLEHRARSIGLEAEGLRVRFDGPGGRLVAMPLYGYYKAPPAGRKWSDALQGARDFGIDTSTWATTFPGSVAARAQWWAQVLRRYPIRCTETFRVDRLNDVLTIRSAFDYIDIRDDWGTAPRTLAPLSPTLALALTDEHNRFPMRFSGPVIDPFVMTPHGPYMGIQDQPSYEIEFDTLKYINEVERAEPPRADAPRLAREAHGRLQATAALRWQTSDRMAVDYGVENYVWAAMGDRFYPMALPYIGDAKVQANARESLRKYFGEWVLQRERFSEYVGPVEAWRNALLLPGPGIASWGELGDAGKFSENLYPGLWSYAHYASDIGTIKQRWDLVKRLDITPLESGWKGFGRNSIAEMGDEAAPPIYYARLAWMAGDIDTYYYQCYIATRELLHQFVKQNGAQYFRTLQPYHQYFQNARSPGVIEVIPAQVFISNLYGGLHGWQVDGPTYPRQHGERQYQNRWVRFSSPSVGRFYRDHIRASDLRQEFEGWKARYADKPEPGTGSQWLHDDPHIMPSLVRLLSLTLDPPVSELEALAVHQGERAHYDRWRLQPDSGVFASAISIMRLSHPRPYERLVPKAGPPGPYVLGLERSIPSQWSVLIQQLENLDSNRTRAWPVVGWTNWHTPRQPVTLPGSQLFSFGAVTPRPGSAPRRTSGWTQLNWNTYIEWYEG